MFKNCESLRSVSLPKSLTKINGMFSGCKFLKNVDIPDTVTKIDCGAFSYCDFIESVRIPECVTEIGMHSFEHCISLKSIRIPKNETCTFLLKTFEKFVKVFSRNSLLQKIPSSSSSIERIFWRFVPSKCCASFASAVKKSCIEVNFCIGTFDGLYSIRTLPVSRLFSMWFTASHLCRIERAFSTKSDSLKIGARRRTRPGKKLVIIFTPDTKAAALPSR